MSAIKVVKKTASIEPTTEAKSAPPVETATEVPTMTPKRKGVFERRKGARITVQLKGGVLIAGTVEYYQEGFLKLTDPIIRGKDREARPSHVFIDRTSIGHFHPDCEVTDIGSSEGGNNF